jgi:hypothetical protein
MSRWRLEVCLGGESLKGGKNLSGRMTHMREREITRERKNGREFEILDLINHKSIY